MCTLAEKNATIRGELLKIIRRKVDPSYAENLGILDGRKKSLSVCRAIALAQVKKGLEGDLKAAEFIENVLSDDVGEENNGAEFRVELKVVGDDRA